MFVNEITQLKSILKHIDPTWHEVFCDHWYQGLDPYKENKDVLMLMANATLTHFEIPLYVTDVNWADKNSCFIWEFGESTSPDYPNQKST